MTVQSIIDVEINDERFKRFLELYKQFQGMLGKMPAEWRAGADAAAEVVEEAKKIPGVMQDALDAAAATTAEVKEMPDALDGASASADTLVRHFGLLTSALMAQNELYREQDRERERADKTAVSARKEKNEADKESAKIDRERKKSEADHRKAQETFLKDSATLTGKIAQEARGITTMFTGSAAGLLGAGGIAGALGAVWGIASDVGHARTVAQSLGATAGETKAFDTDLGRLGLNAGFIGNVRDMATDMSRASLFGQAGIPQSEVEDAKKSGDFSQLSIDAIKAAKAAWDRTTPENRTQQILDTTGLGAGGLGMTMATWGTIGAQKPEELDQFVKDFQRDKQSMALPDATQKGYQDLAVSFSRLAADIEKSLLGDGTMGLLGKAVGDLDEIVKNKGWTGILTTDVSSPLPALPHKWTLPGLLGYGNDDPKPAVPLGGGNYWPNVMGSPASPPNFRTPAGTPTAPGSQFDFGDIENQFGLPPGMLEGLAMKESSQRAHPRDTFDGKNPEWHRGAFQMSDTMLRKLGVKDPYDPQEQGRAAAKELSGYLKRNGGDVAGAIAAWNEGEPAELRQQAQKGPRQSVYGTLDPGLKAYVDSVMRSIKVDLTVNNASGANLAITANAVAPTR